jgi:hypothetical protein
MKTNKFKIIALSSIMISSIITSCSKDDTVTPTTPTVPTTPVVVNPPDFSGTFILKDQMARPAINTVFIEAGAPKDEFNNTIPSAMGGKFKQVFLDKLKALNKDYTTNALGINDIDFASNLATDVLNVDKTMITTFFNGKETLTGRALADDVIDTELLLIFGGMTGTEKPGLTSDNVKENDKKFLTEFPYLAGAW